VDEAFIATAWTNGSHHPSGAGYGIKLASMDRDRFLDRSWDIVGVDIPGFPDRTEVTCGKASMWNGTCRELIHKNIGLWLRAAGAAPWPEGKPPKIRVRVLQDRALGLSLA
jgi:hypothetical protein